MRLLDPSTGGMVHSPKGLKEKAWVLRSREKGKSDGRGRGKKVPAATVREYSVLSWRGKALLTGSGTVLPG